MRWSYSDWCVITALHLMLVVEGTPALEFIS